MAKGFQLSWTIEGETQFSRRLRNVVLDKEDLKRPLQKAAQNLVRTFGNEVFASRGSEIQESWAALSPVTLARKARMGYPSDPLVATGEMKRGFRSIVSTDQAVIYNTAPYFKYHQSNQARRKIPRRVMMKLGFNQREMIVKEFQKEWRLKMKKA